ncbi:MAG: hypothetical protein JXA13_11300 [Anaerolineales bacterium]|nr:hypothetical protein [Anaerolineales bacterium]
MAMLVKGTVPVIYAHRGASAHAPENTIAAFELALEQAADGIELDAKLTADEHVVVIHDQDVMRTTDARGRVNQLKLCDLQRFDAGSHFSQEYRGERIPTLDQVFEAVGKKLIINVELTNYASPFDMLVEKVMKLIKRHNLEKSVLLSSFFPHNLKKASRLLPQAPRALLAYQGFPGMWGRSFGFMLGDYEALHPNFADITHPQVVRVHRLKRLVNVWTVNRPDEIRRLQVMGVDGIITDDPKLARQVLQQAT